MKPKYRKIFVFTKKFLEVIQIYQNGDVNKVVTLEVISGYLFIAVLFHGERSNTLHNSHFCASSFYMTLYWFRISTLKIFTGYFRLQWRIYTQKFPVHAPSPPHHTPIIGPNSFVFTYFLPKSARVSSPRPSRVGHWTGLKYLPLAFSSMNECKINVFIK